MKLIIQIPCLNEANTLSSVVGDLPKKIKGITTIEYLVIDDGSNDKTVDVAKSLKVNHILSLGTNRGLAQAFEKGVEFSLKKGADIIVNTDGDNQYNGKDIEKLVEPIINNYGDMVIGCRPIINHPEFSKTKKLLQLVGSFILRRLSQTTVKDATSGFRAISRETALKLIIHSKFSYTLETLIQAGNIGLRVVSIDININLKTRDSRLFSSIPIYLKNSFKTIISITFYYRPSLIFNIMASFLFTGSLFLGGRFIYLTYLTPSPDIERTYIPSLILLSILGTLSVIVFLVGFVAELLAKHRRITEQVMKEVRYLRFREKN